MKGLLFILCLFSALSLCSQSIGERLQTHQEAYPLEKIYISHNQPYYASGDTLYGKVFVVNGRNHQYFDGTPIVYVDWMTESGTILESLILKIKEGTANLAIPLTRESGEGRFLLRAYTQYQKNFDEHFIFQKEMHYTAIQYAHLALLVGIAFLLGNLSVSYLLKKINIQNIILYSASVILICNTGLFLFSLSYPLSSWEIISLTFMSIFCVGLLFPCAYGLALGVFTNLAGIAGSIIGSLMCFGAVIVTVLISYLNISTAIGYTTLYFIIAILCFIFSLLVFRESV